MLTIETVLAQFEADVAATCDSLEAARAARDALYAVYNESSEGRPEDTVAQFAKTVGYTVAVATVATLVNSTAWDGRISRRNAAWAAAVADSYDDAACREWWLGNDTSRLHPAHLDQIADAMRRYEPEPEPEAEPEPETLLDRAMQAAQIAQSGEGLPEEARTPEYTVAVGMNGKKYVTRESAGSMLHLVEGNSKTGPCINFNLPIEYTCDHRCECYRLGMCYACSGCYAFPNNQRDYTENLNFFKACAKPSIFAAAILAKLSKEGKLAKLRKFRWFTCGDILNRDFFEAMVLVAIARPDIEFWAYTKKYAIVNRWIAEHGILPGNLTIIFSHWMNDDGSFFPMKNPYSLPTSEFIPLGKEDEIHVTHVCPCSDPTVKATCDTCDHPCYRLKAGESMGLQEHSTTRTKARDKAIRAAKAALK